MKPRALIVLLAALSMLGALSIDSYLPALPSIGHEFTISPAAAQQTLSIFLFGYAFMTLFYGTLSDSFGRRPVILVALTVYLVASVGCAFATSFIWLMLFRLLQGLCAGAGNVVGRAMVGDLFHGAEAQRVMSFIQMVFGIAPAFAPIMGGWLEDAFGWRYIFHFIVLFSLVLLAISLRLLPESLDVAKRHPFHAKVILGNYWKVGSHMRFLLMCLGNALTFTGTSIYIGAAPVFIYSILHLSPRDFGWLFIPLITGMTLGSMLSARLSHRFSPNAIIRLGFAVMFISAVANVVYNAVFAASLPWAVIAPFFYCLGMALAGPAMMMLILNMFPKTRGLASSLMSFVFMTMFAISSGLICPYIFDSALHLAEGILVGCLLSGVCWRLGAPRTNGNAVVEHVPTPDEIPVEL
jgi:DHA1 family bicyclomycin/chloramphenicol resistance-like MFS transporter